MTPKETLDDNALGLLRIFVAQQHVAAAQHEHRTTTTGRRAVDDGPDRSLEDGQFAGRIGLLGVEDDDEQSTVATSAPDQSQALLVGRIPHARMVDDHERYTRRSARSGCGLERSTDLRLRCQHDRTDRESHLLRERRADQRVAIQRSRHTPKTKTAHRIVIGVPDLDR
jgi:hypothetical protein